jgi:long-subunit fatty acid transport protein
VFAAAILGMGIVPAGTAFSQFDDTPVELQETNYFGMGARAMGMGGSYVAVSEDVAAMFYNPAGLVQVRRPELAGGLSVDTRDVTTTHTAIRTVSDTHTRLEHVAVAYPVPSYRGGLAMGFAFRRYADLDQLFFKEGFLIQPTPSTRGLFELEEYQRNGAVNAWTGAAAVDISPNISIGGSLSYLSGNSTETQVLGNYRATLVGNTVELDLGSPSDPDDRLFEQQVFRDANLYGWTGAVGIMFYLDPGFRLGANFDFPAWINWDGASEFRLEDWEKIDSNFGRPSFFRDDITIPLSLSGGASWGYQGLLLAGGVRWTDYTQTDFEGKILAPSDGTTFLRESAYRSVVAFNVGAEYQLPNIPLRFRAGYYTKPLPYRLIAADTDFEFVPDDGDADTFDDFSVVFRDYPFADIVSDQHFYTLGTGVLIQNVLSLDLAYQHGSWERSTPAGYVNSTPFYPTLPTIEEVSQNRWFLSTTVHFR